MADSLEKSEKKLEQKIEAKVEKDLEKKWAVKNFDSLRKEMPKSEVGILIHNYDFLFSDFDSRPLHQRAISDDFLREVRKFTFEESPGIAELRFLVPEHERSNALELIIKKRLREHFKKHSLVLMKEKLSTFRKASILISSGFALMVGAALVQHYFVSNFLASLVIIVMEPSGWFSLWYGLDQIFYYSKEKNSEFEFYERMSKADVKFDSY